MGDVVEFPTFRRGRTYPGLETGGHPKRSPIRVDLAVAGIDLTQAGGDRTRASDTATRARTDTACSDAARAALTRAGGDLEQGVHRMQAAAALLAEAVADCRRLAQESARPGPARL